MPTPANIIKEVRYMLDESSATSAMYTDEMLRTWINEAGRDLARASRHIKDSIRIDAYPDDGFSFPLPKNVIAVESAHWADEYGERSYELQACHMEEVRNVIPQGGGQPHSFTVFGSQPRIVIMLFPCPTIAGRLLIYACVTPQPIATDGSTDNIDIEFPGTWYDALTDYVEMKALRRDRDPRWQEANQLYQEKRDALIVSPDYLAVDRGYVSNPHHGYLPSWITEFD